MYSFKIRDRQTSVAIRPLSAECVGIASVGVLGVAQCVVTASWRGRGTCVELQVADRQEGAAVSFRFR
jgi:hypothetical protein